MKMRKQPERLEVADFSAHPVWMFAGSDAQGETLMRPVGRLPVKNLNGKVVGTQVRLANGSSVWAILQNMNPDRPRMMEHYLSLSVLNNGRWFHLARYFDHDYEERGPAALAGLLGLSVDQVFPIAFDVRKYVNAQPAALAGFIHKEPREKLTMDEIIAMAVERVDL